MKDDSIKEYPCDVKCCEQCIWYDDDLLLKGHCVNYGFTNIDKHIKNCSKD